MTVPMLWQSRSLFAAYAVGGSFWGALAASLPALQVRAGLGDGAFGLLLGLMSLGAFPVMRLLGRVLSRIERWAIPGALAGFAAGCLVLAGSGGLPGLILAFTIVGGASGALDIALNARTARLERTGGLTLFNRTHALFPAASVVASVATGALRGAGVPIWVVFVALGLAMLAVAAAEAAAARDVRPAPAMPGPRTGAALGGVLGLLAAMAAMSAAQEAAAQTWLSIFVERVQAAGPVFGGLAPAAFVLGLSAGRLAAHAVDARLRAMTAVRLAAVVAVASFAAIAVGGPVTVTVALAFFAGMGVGPIEPAVFRAVANRTDDDARGPALAGVTAIAYLGYLVSPPVMGAVADAMGYPALWLVAAGMAVAVVVLAWRVRRA